MMNLTRNNARHSSKAPHNKGIQNPTLSLLVMPIEIEIIATKTR
jgi:hypothetical protein